MDIECVFGWDLPAGCSLADIEEAFGDESDEKPIQPTQNSVTDFELFDSSELDDMPFEKVR
jgi:hypothetical protein